MCRPQITWRYVSQNSFPKVFLWILIFFLHIVSSTLIPHCIMDLIGRWPHLVKRQAQVPYSSSLFQVNMEPSWETYRRTYFTYKVQHEAASVECECFTGSANSQDKLEVLKIYVDAMNRYVPYYFYSIPQWTEITSHHSSCRELTYHRVYWNNEWGAQDPGHTRWMERLEMILTLRRQHWPIEWTLSAIQWSITACQAPVAIAIALTTMEGC